MCPYSTTRLLGGSFWPRRSPGRRVVDGDGDEERRETALGRAVRHGHRTLVALLLERGADPDAVVWASEYVRRGPQYTDNGGFVSIPVTVRELAERLRADEIVQLLAAVSSAGPPRAAR